MLKRCVIIGASAIVLSAVQAIHAAVYTVGVGQTYSTIQAAVNAAAATDNPNATTNTPPASPVDIVIYSGTYNELVNIPADPSDQANSQNDYWTIQAAPNAKVWVDGNFTIGQNREDGTINGINIHQSNGTGDGYEFALANTARNWTVENGIVYNDGTLVTDQPTDATSVYGTDYFDHMTIYNTNGGGDANYASTLIFHNTIFANTSKYAAAIGGVYVDHSIFYQNLADFADGAVDAGNNLFEVNPMFASTDPNSPNFLKLLPNSPAIGIASDSGLYAGNDIGALGVVPEPVSGSLMLMGLPMLLLRKRRAASGT